MITEMTLFGTIAIHHLLIGLCLFGLMCIVTKCFALSAETQNWLWVTIFIVSTVAPFTLINVDKERSTPSVNITSVNESTAILDLSDAYQPTKAQKRIPPNWHVPSGMIFGIQSLLYTFCVLWIFGSIWRLFQLVGSVSRTRYLSATATPSGIATNEIPHVDILISSYAKSPLAVGLMRPQIILPANFLHNLSEQQLLPILMHEYAHIQRKDLWVSAFQETLAIAFWWSPAIRLINRKIHISRELACDLRAVRHLNSSKRYLQSLLDSTKLMLTHKTNVLALGLFSKKKDLTYRINQVMNENSKRKPNTSLIAFYCLCLSGVTIATANAFAPSIDLQAVERDGNHFSKLSRAQGEMLMEAIKSNDKSLLNLMFDNGLDINTPIVGDGTALIIAVKANNEHMMETLISLGADVNQSSRGDGNPLIAAAGNNNVKLTKRLLDFGADVNAIVPGDETPLITASRRGNFEVVEYLVSQGADVNLGVMANESFAKEYRTPLNKAATHKIRRFLISQGATEY